MIPRQEHLRDPNAHVLNTPTPIVVVERAKDKATVWIANSPWGWGHQAREFLNPASVGIDKYAEQLLGKIRDSAAREVDRRGRIEAAKRRSRDPATGGEA